MRSILDRVAPATRLGGYLIVCAWLDVDIGTCRAASGLPVSQCLRQGGFEQAWGRTITVALLLIRSGTRNGVSSGFDRADLRECASLARSPMRSGLEELMSDRTTIVIAPQSEPAPTPDADEGVRAPGRDADEGVRAPLRRKHGPQLVSRVGSKLGNVA